MIQLTPPVSYPRPDNYYATERQVESIEIQILDDSTSCSNYVLCSDDCLPVFANLGSTSSRFNDFSSHLYNLATGSTITATLTNKDGFSQVITNSDYGDFYPTDTLKTGYWGLVLDWKLIAGLEGFSKYCLNIQIESAGGSLIYDQDFKYRLMESSCISMDGTVRLTTKKTGYVVNGLDYRDLSIGEWLDQTRLYGKFELTNHETEIDNVLTSGRNLHQIQTQIKDNFNLRIDNVKSKVAQSFIKDELLSNEMFVDDYNTNNLDEHKQQYVSLVSIDDPIKAPINGTYIYNIKLTEFNQSTLKRNF